jgi:tryptophan synthase alpha chain
MFETLLQPQKPQLIPFLMAGYPSLEATEILASELIEQGVQILELGVPFSDPMADGPVIQMAAEKSLAAGTTLRGVLGLCRKIQGKYPSVKIVIFSYLNPLLAYGLANYTKDAQEAGAAATLTVDLPPEEATEYLHLHLQQGLKTVFLASPTTSTSRLSLINQCSSAFVYYVSRAGVTGEQANLSVSLEAEVRSLRKAVSKPVAVGFGISDPQQAQVVSRFSDAVVIGSALIRLTSESTSVKEAQLRLREFTRSCLAAMST